MKKIQYVSDNIRLPVTNVWKILVNGAIGMSFCSAFFYRYFSPYFKFSFAYMKEGLMHLIFGSNLPVT